MNSFILSGLKTRAWLPSANDMPTAASSITVPFPGETKRILMEMRTAYKLKRKYIEHFITLFFMTFDFES